VISILALGLDSTGAYLRRNLCSRLPSPWSNGAVHSTCSTTWTPTYFSTSSRPRRGTLALYILFALEADVVCTALALQPGLPRTFRRRADLGATHPPFIPYVCHRNLIWVHSTCSLTGTPMPSKLTLLRCIYSLPKMPTTFDVEPDSVPCIFSLIRTPTYLLPSALVQRGGAHNTYSYPGRERPPLQ
jgi:hypothetical protein